MSTRTAVSPAPEGTTTGDVIEVSDLTFTYPKAAGPAVRGMSFAVGPGEIFGFLGPSGAGKSTTQKILIGLLAGYRGEVRVWGTERGAWGHDFYENIGVSFELPNHYQKLTARENLDFFASLYDRDTADPRELLDMVGLGGDADTLVGKFSKGMQNRLTFVRSLVHRPGLLFLDEPTSGLDPTNARRVREIVRDLQREGRTIFLTTHDMTVADEVCDRVAFVVDGRIAALDAPGELKVRRGERRVRVDYRQPGEGAAGLASREFDLDGLADDEDFHALLRNARVEAVHSKEATLEDIFVDETGRGLT